VDDQDEAILVQCQGVDRVLGVLGGVHRALLVDGEERDCAILSSLIHTKQVLVEFSVLKVETTSPCMMEYTSTVPA